VRAAVSDQIATNELPWPRHGLEAVGRCPLCQSTTRRQLYSGLTDRMAHPARGRWTIWECCACSAGYLDPRPTQSTIALAYHPDYYTHQPRPTQAPGLRARIRTRVRHGHLNRSLGYELKPASAVGGALLGVSRRRAEISSSSVRHLPFRAGGRVLDIGAGAGAFVALMRNAGWHAEGIDPDPDSVRAAQLSNVPVTCARVEDALADGNEDMFDAITMNHVIEHLHDPPAVLEICRRLLRPNGVLWIATPNLDGQGHLRFGRYWVHLDPPRHLVLFTTGSLKAALVKAGFTDTRLVLTRSIRPKWSFCASAAIAQAEASHSGPGPLDVKREVLAARLGLRLHPSRTEEIAITARPRDSQ
jgi:2-polyprenyl-3-methyl-5-hydroxy-6-metoxy-1,4-benzoquinol methylase